MNVKQKQELDKAKQSMNDRSLRFAAILYSLLFVSGGILCLMNDFVAGASSFALGAIFSSTNTPWKALPGWIKVTITLSTIFGISALITGIVLFG